MPAAEPYPFYGCGENVDLTDEQFYKRTHLPSLPVLRSIINQDGTCLAVSMVTHTCAIATDLLVVVLTWIKTFEIKRVAAGLRLKTSLTTLLLRDGTLYFGCVRVIHTPW